MAKVSLNKTSFNAGELSPRVDGRVDLAKYSSGCKQVQNFIPLVQGALQRRPGTRFVSEVKNSANTTWLAKFEFNFQQSFILEFGVNYIRFYSNHAQLVTGTVTAWNAATAYTIGDIASTAGVNYYCILAHTNHAQPNAAYWYPLTDDIYEVPTPYTATELTTSENGFGLSLVQSGDVIYICHRNIAPQKLSRISNNKWSLAAVEFAPPPFERVNADNTIVVKWDEAGLDLEASASLFVASDANSWFYVEQSAIDVNKPWVTATAVGATEYRRNDGKNYYTVAGGTTGYVSPIHTVGSKLDGDPGVTWEYHDDTTAYFKLGAYVSATDMLATAKVTVPTDILKANNGTKRWAKSAWRSEVGYPTHVTFFRERLTFARDQKIWFSCAGDYENFASNEFGQILADSAISIEVQSDTASQIVGITPMAQGLMVNTTDGEVFVSEASISEAFAPTNVKISQQGGYGARQVRPVRVDNAVLFVQRAGKKLRETNYDYSTDSFIAADVTILADHITNGGIVDMAFHREPYNVLWAVRSDGVLLGFTYNKLQDVSGWHRHIIGGSFGSGNSVVESVQVIPRYDGTRDDVWLIVKRTINGATKRYIEYLEKDYEDGDLQNTCYYVDCGATYSGSATTIVTGLTWLEGQTVQVLADGANHPDCVVTSGAITLQLASSVVQIGLRNTPLMQTMRPEGGSQNGTSQGKLKRISIVVIRLLNSLGVKAGINSGNYPWQLLDINNRRPITPMDTPNTLFTGDSSINIDGGVESDATISVTSDQAYPITLISIMPDINTHDR